MADNIRVTCRSAVVVPAGHGDVLVCFQPTEAAIKTAKAAAKHPETTRKITLLDGPKTDRHPYTGAGLLCVVYANYDERTDSLVIQTLRLGIGN